MRAISRYYKSGGNILIEIVDGRKKDGQNKRNQLIERDEKIFMKW